jgi:sulfotransferase
MEKLTLIAGLPRSGSTLLCNILNMNPNFHATSTSPVLDVLLSMRTNFSNNITFKTNDRISLYNNMKNGMLGFLKGYYDGKKYIFDKSRGWTAHLMLLDEIMDNKETKVIWTYRNPIDILWSIERQHRKTILMENVDEAGGVNFTTLSARVDAFINDGGIVARPVWLLNDAIEMGYEDRILIIDYWSLTNRTQDTMDKIHKFLGIERFDYDKNNFSDLKQTTVEYDMFYNYKFPHTIKEGEIKYVKHEHKFPDHIIEKINTRFAWVNEYAKNKINEQI